MLFPASVANGMSLGAGGSMGSSFGSYGPRSLYNIKWNGKVSGFLDLIAARAGVSWRYNPTEKRVEFYYLDTRTFRIYAFDDVNTVDSTVRSGMTTAAGISGDGSGSTGQNGSSGISGDSGSKQTTSSELKTSILSDIENSINSMLTPSMGRMSLSRATGTLTVTDRPEVLNRVQQLVNRENESITKQVLLNVNVLSVALTDKDQLGIDWNLVYKSLNNKWGIGLKNTMPGIDQSAISGSVSILDTANRNEYRFGYDEMLIQIQACVPDSQKGDGLPMTMARAQWISQVFVLCTLGNSLARDKGWRLWGMDAIEYALMRRYSWPLETIREMPIRDRWLALHEELADLQWDEEAQQVWLAKIEPVLPGAPGTDYDVWRSDAPGFQLPQAPGYLVVR